MTTLTHHDIDQMDNDRVHYEIIAVLDTIRHLPDTPQLVRQYKTMTDKQVRHLLHRLLDSVNDYLDPTTAN